MNATNSEYKQYRSEYDNILLGNKHRFTDYDTMSKQAAIEVFRYALGYYLGWDIYSIRDNLTEDILDKLKLTKFIPLLNFPVELDRHRDLFYIAHLLEPDKVSYNFADATVKMYKEVVSGERKSTPQHFFTDAKAKQRAALCLRYAITNYTYFNSMEEAYRFFASSSAAPFLLKYKLNRASKYLYDSNLEFFHYSLPASERNEILFAFYGIKSECGRVTWNED